jgi:hypothetical protein
MREEIQRVLFIAGAQCFFGATILLLVYFDIVLIGPILGVIIISLTAYPLILLIKRMDNWLTQLGAYILLAVLVALWAQFGYQICSSFWPSPILINLHIFARILTLTLSLGIKAIFIWCLYILWIELTDPNWPSPRQAVLRDGPFVPGFTHETYGGQLLPETSTFPSLPTRTITVQLNKDDNGKHTESVAHIPDQDNWREFAWAVAHHGKGFTEATARAYNVPLTDIRDGAGQLITIGMRTLREQFLRRGWLEWKNPEVHERGVRVTEKGQAVLEAIGEESE